MPDRVADALRIEFTSSDVLCSTSPSETFQQALSRRGTYIVRLIGGYRSLRRDMRSLGSVVAEATGYEVEEASEALEGANVLLVEPCFAGGAGLFVEPEVASVVELASRLEVPVWALLGAGRVLSSQLAETAADLAGDGFELVAPMVVSRAVDCNGIGDLRAALGRASCPPGTELVHRIGR